MVLEGLVRAGHDVSLVVTRADKRRSRRGAPESSAVKRVALELGIDVSNEVKDLTELGVDRGVVVAFGQIIKPPVLGRVPLVNVHFSLLPRWRGAAPVERAILAGDTETGVSLMELEAGLDTGGVYDSAATPIGPRESAAQLKKRLAELGRDLLLRDLAAGLARPRPQEGEATYADKVDSEELHIDWSRTASELDRLVRAGRAWTTWHNKRLIVLKAEPSPRPSCSATGQIDGDTVATRQGGLRILEVKPEGKRAMTFPAWRAGARPVPGDRFGG